MVLICGEWTPFANENDKIEHYRLWGLIPPKSRKLRPIMAVDGYFGSPVPCTVVGHQDDKWAVIQLEDGLHVIHGDTLAEMQPSAQQYLPRGVCFAEILSDYIIIDIETTGLSRQNDRIIEIAAIRYQYGKAVEQFSTLVNPGRLLSPRIRKLTGITQDEVDSAPVLDEVAGDFLDFLGTLPIIGHNAMGFDIPFLVAQLGTEITNPIIDTLTMARKVFGLLPTHKLSYLNEILQLDATSSHRALADVETTNNLLWACLAPKKYESKVYHAFLNHRLECDKETATQATTKIAPHIQPSTKPVNGPLLGKTIVFTGELCISRADACQMAENAGAVVKSGVSRKIDYLVAGWQDASLVGEDGMSNKEARAHEINESGKGHVEIIDMETFLALVAKGGGDE